MFDALNQQFFSVLGAPPAPSGDIFTFAMFLAEAAIYIGPCVLALLWIFGEHEERLAAIDASLSALLAVAAAAIISSVWMHPRPFMVLQIRNYLDRSSDSSFPSDHSTFLFALGFSLLLHPTPLGRRSGVLLIVVGIAVGWARVFLGSHFPFDVVGAAVVGAITASAIALPIARFAGDRLTALCERLFGYPSAGQQ